MNVKKNTITFRVLTVLYLAALSLLCFSPFEGFPSIPVEMFGIQTDKIVHFCMFLPFPFLVYLSIPTCFKTPWRSVWGIFLVFLAGCAIAGATEIAQGFTDTRTPDPLDFKADSISLALSSFLVFIFNLVKKGPGNEK